ncbi:hypothetical protein Tco_1027484 [Tanacetum coccineum]
MRVEREREMRRIGRERERESEERRIGREMREGERESESRDSAREESDERRKSVKVKDETQPEESESGCSLKTWLVSPGSNEIPLLLFDRSFEDVYSDPGSPMFRRTPAGTYVIAEFKKENKEGTYILLNGSGATLERNIPFFAYL